MNILLTGFTGNLGPEIARQLAPHRVLALVREPALGPAQPGVTLVEGSLEQLPAGLTGEVEAIVHSAASTAFRAPLAQLRAANVEGTDRLLAYARACPRLRRFVHLSTICVFGNRTGLLPEEPLVEAPHFLNDYERTKWEAERLVLASGLPVEIARLAIVAGSEHDGAVRRPGALHHTLLWLYQALIPMLPGSPETPVDLISTEFAAAGVAELVRTPGQPGRVIHVSSGEQAPPLGELLPFLVTEFGQRHRGWASGAVSTPDLVDAQTFALFEASARQSGDLLFQRICQDAQSFLPGLLYPRRAATSLVRGLPLAPWRVLAGLVFQWVLAHRHERPAKTLSLSHAHS